MISVPPRNPTEFKKALTSLFEQSPLQVGGSVVDTNIVNQALDEVVGAMVKSYLKEGEPTACEYLTARFFIAMVESLVESETK